MAWHQAESSEAAPELHLAASPHQQCQQSAPARLAAMAGNTMPREPCQLGGPFTVPSNSWYPKGDTKHDSRLCYIKNWVWAMPTLISHLLKHRAPRQQVFKALWCCPRFADSAVWAQKVFVNTEGVCPGVLSRHCPDPGPAKGVTAGRGHRGHCNPRQC